jgi:hypothetical protein
MNNSNTKEEIVFADGFKFRIKHVNAPDFVLGSLSIKVDDAISFLKANQKNGWVNLGIKESRAGNPYMFVDTFEAKKSEEPVDTKAEESEDLPF